ncbi:MAG: hypothetical protein HY277_01260, partial [Ignavibacteriales bacterium]|nr:hypothetical protein [Ignavibacteriales bacterium]
GENYNMDGSRGNAADDTIGVTVTTAAESVLVAGYDSKITGDPNNIRVMPPDNPANYVNEYISGADIVFPNGSNNNGNYGTKANPVLGYADGSVTFGGNGTFYGVLIIHGAVEFVGTFKMYGLIIAYGESNTVEVNADLGTPQIYGGLLATGPVGSQFEMKGTADMRYSKEALTMAKFITKLQAYRVMWWYE